MTEQLSAAEKYDRLLEQQFDNFIEQSFTDEALKGVQLYEVKAASGQVFKCRPLDAAFHAAAGGMPMSLANMVGTEIDPADINDDAKNAELFKKMSPPERKAAIKMTAQIVLYVAVEPRIVGELNGRRDAIAIEQISGPDIASLTTWARGGDAAGGLKTFRRKRR